MKSTFRACFLAAFLLALAACSALGLATPQTFNERANAAEQSVSALYRSANVALTNGQITAKTAQAVADAGGTARKGIDAARDIYVKACPASAPRPAASGPVAVVACTSPQSTSVLDAALVGLDAWAALIAAQGVKK